MSFVSFIILLACVAVSYQGFIAGRLSTLCGTPEYVPPEMLGPNRFYRGEFVDPWALGVLAYELVVGDSPFHLDDHHEIVGNDVELTDLCFGRTNNILESSFATNRTPPRCASVTTRAVSTSRKFPNTYP